jgi:transposase InsO family protein
VIAAKHSVFPMPKGWPEHVRSAILQVIGSAQLALAGTRGWAANSVNSRIRLKAQLDQARQEIAMLHEEIRIKDVRMARIDPHRRPQYPPTERMSILELKTARGWSLKQTARTLQVAAATIASWLRRIDEHGPDALVQLREPVNKFPDFVRHLVQRLKTLCPTMGKVKIAQTLARAGLHLGSTTIGRVLKEEPHHEPSTTDGETTSERRIVTAKYPGHVWHVDLTVVPTGGFSTSWMPFSLPQCWPFCHWVAIVIDHCSRRVMGATAFKRQPSSEAVRAFLGRSIARAGKAPKYIVCDRGKQFDCKGFRNWCRRRGIQPPRYGAIGKHGSIAVVERLILTAKTILCRLPLLPYRRKTFRLELKVIVDWYNSHRPHSYLGGRTPNEVYRGQYPANRRPRFEPRARWPRGSPCAKPWAPMKGKPGVKLVLEVTHHAGRKHLPIVGLKRAA